jgi:hypothetical protein
MQHSWATLIGRSDSDRAVPEQRAHNLFVTLEQESVLRTGVAGKSNQSVAAFYLSRGLNRAVPQMFQMLSGNLVMS